MISGSKLASSRDPLRPSTSTLSLKYHTVPLERLAAVTLRDLTACGIPARSLGVISAARRVTLVGCVSLNDHARAYLPPELGGDSDDVVVSEVTERLAAASFARSPNGSPSQPSRSPVLMTPPRSHFAPARASPPPSDREALAHLSAAAVASAAAADAAAVAAEGAAAQLLSERAGAVSAALALGSPGPRRSTRQAAARGGGGGGGGGDGGGPAAPALAGGGNGGGGDGGGADTSAIDGEALSPEPFVLDAGADGGVGVPVGSAPAAAASSLAGEGVDGAALSDGVDAMALGAALSRLAGLEVSSARAGAHAVAARLAASQARRVADASISVLSSPGSPGRARPAADASREQQSLAASVTSEAQKADTISGLLEHRRRYPLIMRAFLRRGGGDGMAPASLDDLPLLALLPALLAARLQDHGYGLLHEAAKKAGPSGRPAARAAAAFSLEQFDLLGAQAIEEDQVDFDVSPLDLCAGVLPVAQLGLHLWFRYHSFEASEASALVGLAKAVNFVREKNLDPMHGLSAFMTGWATALRDDDDIPCTEVYFLLLTALHRDREAVGAGSIFVPIRGVATSWTAYANATTLAWRKADGGASRRVASREQLRTLVRTLQAFGEARVSGLDDPLPPPDAEGSAGVFMVSVGTPSPAPPDAGPPPSGFSVGAAPSPCGGPGRGHRGASGRVRDPHTPGRGLPAAPPLRIPIFVLPESPNILSVTPLLRAGWVITLGIGDGTGASGSSIAIPGVSYRFPLVRDSAGTVHVTFVATGPGLVLRDASLAHRLLPSFDFILDTGAEVSLVGASHIALLRELGVPPSVTLTAVGGLRIRPIDTGILLVTPPRGATSSPPVIDPSSGLVLEPSVMYTSVAPPDVDGAAVFAVGVRATAFPPLQSLDVLAERLNLNTASALASFVDACPLGVASGIKRLLEPGKDYSRGLASAALLKAPAIHASRYTISVALRDSVPHGHIWWTDVSNARPPDFDGHVYSRLFAEERTGCATTFYSSRKDAATLLEQMDEMVTWINAHVPGGKLQVLRCDFASEAVRQGHGDAIYTAAMASYCDSHPGFRFVPVAPNSQALNRAENTWGRVHGGAYLNARRARIGPIGWSLMERGAVFQHNHAPAPHAIDPASRRCSRWEALTLQLFDVSTMLGFPGQTGYTHRPDGKSNAFRTPTDPVLYLHPATSLHAQLVFNLRSFKIVVVRDVALTVDPYACSLAIASSALHCPAGRVHTPTPDAYEARLNSLLSWRPVGDGGAATVVHDPLLGLPVSVFGLTAHLAEDGHLVMADDSLEELSLPAPGSALPPGAADVALPPGAADIALPAVAAPVLPDPLDASVSPPAAVTPVPGAPWSPSWPQRSVPAARALRDAVKLHLRSALRGVPWPFAVRPGATKTKKSKIRLDAYRHATTVAEYVAAFPPGGGPTWQSDLAYDLQHGIVDVAPGPVALVARVTPAWVPLDFDVGSPLWSGTDPLGPPAARAVYLASLSTAIDADACGATGCTPMPPLALARDAASYSTETATLQRIDALEPSPLPGRSPGSDSHPDTTGDPRRYTEAYACGLRVLRVALVADHADAEAISELDLRQFAVASPTWGDGPDGPAPSIALLAAPRPAAPTAPTSVMDARRRPDFDAPHGWGASITKEVRRVEGFKAWELSSAQAIRADRARYGDARVSIGYLIAVLTCKFDPAGGPRALDVVNKFRIVVSDLADASSGVLTHSNCADDISNRLITAIAPAIGAHQDSIDVGGAYFHGRPPDMAHGGRRLYVRIPPWLAALFPAYPLRGRSGSTNFLLVTGNMPGRCDAGRIWQRRFDEFLVGYGLTQLYVDRRVWTGHSERGALIVHDHVDDSRITSTTTPARVHFHAAWALAFGETIVARELSEDFTGLRHTVVGPYTTTISCGGVIRRLRVLLTDHPLVGSESSRWPLAAMAPRVLLEGPTALRPLVPHLVSVAAPILGTVGFVVSVARPDAYFAYCLLSRYASASRLTEYCFRCIVRLGHYLVGTGDLHLHLTTPSVDHHPDCPSTLDLFDCFVDSSHGNGADGSSHGGFVLASRASPGGTDAASLGGGGALAWRSVAPLAGDDSSAAAELRLATLAYKYVLAARFLQTELNVGIAPLRPTPLYLDAQAVLDGTSCERLVKSSRWLAMRYAMLRWGIACGTIEPRKLLSAENPADGLTKCLVGSDFEKARARLLGLPYAWSPVLLDVDDDEDALPHVGVVPAPSPVVASSGSVGSVRAPTAPSPVAAPSGSVGSVGSVRAPTAPVDASAGHRRRGPPPTGRGPAGFMPLSAVNATPSEGPRRRGPPPVGRGLMGPKPPPPGFVPP